MSRECREQRGRPADKRATLQSFIVRRGYSPAGPVRPPSRQRSPPSARPLRRPPGPSCPPRLRPLETPGSPSPARLHAESLTTGPRVATAAGQLISPTGTTSLPTLRQHHAVRRSSSLFTLHARQYTGSDWRTCLGTLVTCGLGGLLTRGGGADEGGLRMRQAQQVPVAPPAALHILCDLQAESRKASWRFV